MNLHPSASNRVLLERICDFYIITMLLIFPLFPGFSGYLNITRYKYVFFLAATGLWLAALIVGILRSRAPLPRPGGIGTAALAYLLVCTLSWVCSPDRAVSFLGAGRYDGLLTDLAYGLIFLGISLYARPKPLYAHAFALAISLCGLISLLQLGGGNPLRLFPQELSFFDSNRFYSGTFLGTIGNTNILDAVLCLSLPTFFGLYVCGKGRLYIIPVLLSVPTVTKACGDGARLALVLCVPVLLPLMLTDLSRIRRLLLGTAWLSLTAAASVCWQPDAGHPFRFGLPPAAIWLCGTALMLLLLSVLPCPRRFQPSPQKLRRFFALISGLMLLVGIAFVLLAPVESGVIYELQQTLAGNAEDSFGSSRIQIWRRCLALTRERPLLGGGPGTLALRLNIEFSRFIPETGVTLSSFADNAHNIYLGALADTGILGLAAMLTVFVLSAVSALRRVNDCLYASFALGAFSCAVHEFFGLGLCISAPLLWITLGLLCVRPSHSDNNLEDII